jgi:hypothetical protein
MNQYLVTYKYRNLWTPEQVEQTVITGYTYGDAVKNMISVGIPAHDIIGLKAVAK